MTKTTNAEMRSIRNAPPTERKMAQIKNKCEKKKIRNESRYSRKGKKLRRQVLRTVGECGDKKMRNKKFREIIVWKITSVTLLI